MPEALRERAPRLSEPGNSLFLTVDGVEVPPRRTFYTNPNSFTEKIEQADRYKEASKVDFSARSHLQGMEIEGITASVLFPSRGLMVMGVAGVDPEITTASAHAYNTWLSEFVQEDPDRLFGVAMIDPRDVGGAIKEAERAIGELGFIAAFLRPNPVNGLPWHHATYDPLWSTLEDLGVPVCFHEGASVLLPQVGIDRFDEHSFWHCVTHPMEQQMAMMSIVMGGVTERHPTLRFAFLECGAGWLPYWMWRFDEHVENEPGDFTSLTLTPSEYIQRQCFVSIDSEESPGIPTLDVLELPHVVWGSDYPHPDGKFPHALEAVSSLPGMSEEKLRRVVYDGPLELFGDGLRTKLKLIASQS
jgi:predicted TIM-barrel fold metal-dependent hydrolase